MQDINVLTISNCTVELGVQVIKLYYIKGALVANKILMLKKLFEIFVNVKTVFEFIPLALRTALLTLHSD